MTSLRLILLLGAAGLFYSMSPTVQPHCTGFIMQMPEAHFSLTYIYMYIYMLTCPPARWASAKNKYGGVTLIGFDYWWGDFDFIAFHHHHVPTQKQTMQFPCLNNPAAAAAAAVCHQVWRVAAAAAGALCATPAAATIH
jgi:hypothetical protein